MDATPPEKSAADAAAEARRAQRILVITMGVMILLPALLFVVFHT